MIDEGPSIDDLNRFGSDEAHCPECGEEIYDQAEYCPKCHAYLAGNTSSRSPVEREFRGKWYILIAIILLIVFVLTYVL